MGLKSQLSRIDAAKLVHGLEMLKDDVAEIEATNIPDNPSIWWKLVHLDPALYRGLVLAVLAILGACGLVVSEHNAEAIILAVTALVSLIQALWTRKAVTANSKVVVYKPNPVDEPTTVAPGEAVSTDAVAVVNAAAQNQNQPELLLPPNPEGARS